MKPRAVKHSQPKIDPAIQRALIHNQHGTPDEQKDALVKDIISTFQDPSKWPLLETERIAVLRRWFEKSLRIQNTPK